MKLKTLITIVLLSMAQVAFAADEVQRTPMNSDIYPWSLGMDFKYMYFRPTTDYVPILDKNKFGGSIYFAYRPGVTFDYELGFSWTTRDIKYLGVSSGETVLGATATHDATHLCRVRFEDTYFDVHANIPMAKSVEFKLGVGVGFVRQKFRITNHPSYEDDPLQKTLDRLKGKTAATARLIVGAQALLTKRVGLRLMYNYETYQNIRVRDTNPGVNRKLMSNAYTVLVGAFWVFDGS